MDRLRSTLCPSIRTRATPRAIARHTGPLALALALTVAPIAPTLAQTAGSASDPGAPVPLLGPSTGTLDPSQGELDQPPMATPAPADDTTAPQNPDLGPPRVIGGGPGNPPTTELAPPPAPTSPQGQVLAPVGPESAGAPIPTRGSTDPADADALAKALGAVADATVTVRELRRNSGFKVELNDFLGRARAVVVVPSFFKGGFVLGAAYGTALLSVRDDTGAFSEPAFLEMSAGSLGFQAGAQDSRVILLVMTEAGLQAILKDKFKLEAGASISFGTFGGGLSTGSTTDVNQDIVAFSHSRGLFAGGAFEGAVIEPRPHWNAAYYDAPTVTPRAILFDRSVSNAASSPLIEALQEPVPGGG
ncbi:hypothetical protein F1188_13950 [Roseospira marina]|uniref:Ysc84 actin-binding domain-containing protein n=1 Tax=Roseospira marina TaxID=140057 RepID=A0A5M6IAF0_9PROT|nr:lipid-binding SYLF domain-containing protein [Roseospira marina]KAA5604917.1 hypothetical protein F1188_13950 [Roseospira marina]MBB4315258.1 lipid-binding SYLF domain-containing protein [Roseospira marina]MBB5088258.1 lipid-binding SYLF domain-containing protein [Roseospira marina]